MTHKRVKGCYDIFPGSKDLWKDPAVWAYVENIFKKTATLYGFKEAMTPSFEYTDVFTRSSGEASDIVSKEMYTFLDKKGRSISLKPELTAPIIRAYLENAEMNQKMYKLFYLDSCYRYDRPQKGRYRQFRQFGIEVLGKKDPLIDIEVIAMFLQIYKNLGITNTTLLINSIGSKESRETYNAELVSYFSSFKEKLSSDSLSRLEKNPLRILDSKDAEDKKIVANAPKIFDYLTDEEKAHFHQVTEGLDELGISYTIDPLLVRGLDYYTDTVFELIRENDASGQNTLGAGGVYEGIAKSLGGKDVPGIGFAIGMERTIQYFLENNPSFTIENPPTFYCIGLGQEYKKTLLHLALKIRSLEGSAELFEGTSIKSGLKNASEKKARYAIILGEIEFNSGICKIKDLSNREEQSIQLNGLLDWAKKHIKT